MIPYLEENKCSFLSQGMGQGQPSRHWVAPLHLPTTPGWIHVSSTLLLICALGFNIRKVKAESLPCLGPNVCKGERD
jgi:hypothetical protein